jgi:threonine dehydrogenase-like Zn-dependent dehydrogenase
MMQIADGQLAPTTFPMPVTDHDDAILRVEVCGLCGSDVEQFSGKLRSAAFNLQYPLIPGHEPVGVIERIGDRAKARWGVEEGDRVVVEATHRCGSCRDCVEGRYLLCSGPKPGLGYGFTSTDVAPSLWGGFAEYMYLDPNALVHKVRPTTDPALAANFNPLAGAIRWTVHMGEVKPGDTVVIFGPGQRGICSVIAAREAGAERIIITGLQSDRRRLELAESFGATDTVFADEVDVVEFVRDATAGRMADVALEMTAHATQPVVDAIKVVRRGGTVVLVGLKNSQEVSGLVSDLIVHHEVTIKGAQAVTYRAIAEAIRLIESGRYDLSSLRTHEFDLARSERAIRVLAREIPGEDPIGVILRP